MSKRTFQITPKLGEEKKSLPVQDFSPERILEIVNQTRQGRVGEEEEPEKPPRPKSRPKKKSKAAAKKSALAKRSLEEDKRPQGRPRREEPVKRLSSDLPADLYDRVQQEIKVNGYTLNGFLAKVLREYFELRGTLNR